MICSKIVWASCGIYYSLKKIFTIYGIQTKCAILDLYECNAVIESNHPDVVGVSVVMSPHFKTNLAPDDPVSSLLSKYSAIYIMQ
jgi:hypothetical protein